MGIKPIALLVAALLLPALPNMAPGGDAGNQRYLCVDSGAQRLQGMGLAVDESYASFCTLFATPAQERLLWRAGIQFFELGGRDEVVLPGASFTPSAGSFASKGLDSLALGGGQQYLLVKLKGPVKPGWITAIGGTGATFAGGALSHFNFVVLADREQALSVGRLPFVRWMGELRPEHKLPYPLPDGAFRFDMVFFKQATEDFREALRLVWSSGGEVVEKDDGTAWWNSAVVKAPRSVAESVLMLPGLWALETAGAASARNDVARWVVQSDDPLTMATPFWDAGLIGNGEIAGIADSGVDFDHINFRQRMDDAGIPGPDHRKIVRYNTSVDNWDSGAPVGHGTHAAGSLAGDSLVSPMGYDTYDGLAFGARLSVYDITTPDGVWDPPLVRGILGDAYDVGAHTHSDSWGDDRMEYTLRAQRVDQFQWDHPDFLSLWAAGNTGPSNGTVLEPATCKNAVAVGASANGNSTDLASFSAHGPTQEGMIAPLVVAPGKSIRSARSDNQNNTYNEGYSDMSGTSMATPMAAAASILIEQYFLDGFYPDGARRSGPGFQPSGPLRKAILAASGGDQSGGAYVTGPIPDFSQGWGKIDLASALYLAGYPGSNRLWVSDYYNDSHQNDGLATGERRTEMITVNSSRPLKVILAWNDWPGAGLVNDLNLEVTCPNGTVYRGNQIANGSSVVSAAADNVNSLEGVIINRPAPGPYAVRVSAISVSGGEEPGSSRQRYALVAAGDLFDSSVGLVRLDRERTGLRSTVGVSLLDSDLRGTGRVTVFAESATETYPEPVELGETATAGLFEGTLEVAPGVVAHDGTLQVVNGDTVRVYYEDLIPPATSYDTCVVDGSPPVLVRAELDNVTNNSAFVRVWTDEVSTLRVGFRDGSGARNASDRIPGFSHELELSGLLPRTNYTLDIEVEDLFGNSQRVAPVSGPVSLRTYDLTYRPPPGYAGWATDLEGGNRFAQEGLSSGVLSGYPRMAGFRFDAADYPRGVLVTGGQVRLMVRNTDAAYADSLWTVELLDASAAPLFDGASRPNYTLLRDAGYEDYLGDQFGPSTLTPGRWQLLNLTEAQCRVLGRMLDGGYAAFRIKGPLSGPSSLLEWYSGRSAATVFWAPQLDLHIAYPPRVAPSAPSTLFMDEDTVDTTSINCSRIFTDDEPMRFDAPLNADGSGANLTVTVDAGGRTTFRPRQDWNGAGPVVLRATDRFGLSTTHSVDVTVRPVNDPPRIVAVNGTAPRDGMQFTARQDEPFTISIEVSDPDLQYEGERLWYVTNDTLVRFASPSSPVIAFEPTNDDVGTRRVRLTVRDPDYEDSVNLTFVIENANDPPTAYLEYPSPNGSYDNVTPVRFSGWGSFDPDLRWGDLLNYTWELNGTDLIGHGEELNATLPPGRHAVTLIVRDLSGAFDTVSVELSVAAVEPPPVIIDNGSKPPARSWWRDFFVAGGLLVILLMAIVAAFLLTRRGARGAAEESSDAAVAKAIVKKKQGGGKKGKLPPKRPEPSAADEEPYGEADDALDVKAVGEEGEPK